MHASLLCMFLYIYVCVCMYVESICMSLCVGGVYECMHACVSLCVYCMCVRTYVYFSPCIYTCVHVMCLCLYTWGLPIYQCGFVFVCVFLCLS